MADDKPLRPRERCERPDTIGNLLMDAAHIAPSGAVPPEAQHWLGWLRTSAAVEIDIDKRSRQPFRT